MQIIIYHYHIFVNNHNCILVPVLISPWPISRYFLSNLLLNATFSPMLVHTGKCNLILMMSYNISLILHRWLWWFYLVSMLNPRWTSMFLPLKASLSWLPTYSPPTSSCRSVFSSCGTLWKFIWKYRVMNPQLRAHCPPFDHYESY